MSMPRIDFHGLPAAARQAVTLHTVPVRSVRPAEAGRNSAVAAVLTTASGPVFVKGIPVDHPQAAAQHREVAIAPHLPALAPRLLWHEEVAGWQAARGRPGRRAARLPGAGAQAGGVLTPAVHASNACPSFE
ncbi:hypothetical protein [Streptomyces chartreusis]|uniref:hypothetical protein n=1 Tax=Streptomyces chartreusis TaxID=1969 RepID=UPI002E18038B